MDCIEILGGSRLKGEVAVQGSKNAALPIMAACILIPGVTVLKNCPRILDVECMCSILRSIGATVRWEGDALVIDAGQISQCRLPREYVTRMRSSVMVAGAMLGRCREISLHYPGGCVIGDRPIDLHIKALQQLGAVFTEQGDFLTAAAPTLKGNRICLSFPSVGATENVILAAVCAEGCTEVFGCAREPEIAALCSFLNAAGARIQGMGSPCLVIEGVKRLHGGQWDIEADRIVAGTYLAGALAAGGCIYLRNAPSGQMQSVLDIAACMGAEFLQDSGGIRIRREGRLLSPGCLETGVYPAFPTDLQSQMLTALCLADGESALTERIFNGRFVVIEELNRMGAHIEVSKNTAYLRGGARLTGQSVTAKELRGGAALALAGIAAEGYTRIYNRHFIDRGYEDIVRDLKSLGANIGSKEELPADGRRES